MKKLLGLCTLSMIGSFGTLMVQSNQNSNQVSVKFFEYEDEDFEEEFQPTGNCTVHGADGLNYSGCWGGGDGTPSNPYQVSNYDEFKNIGFWTEGEQAYFIITQNINVNVEHELFNIENITLNGNDKTINFNKGHKSALTNSTLSIYDRSMFWGVINCSISNLQININYGSDLELPAEIRELNTAGFATLAQRSNFKNISVTALNGAVDMQMLSQAFFMHNAGFINQIEFEEDSFVEGIQVQGDIIVKNYKPDQDASLNVGGIFNLITTLGNEVIDGIKVENIQYNGNIKVESNSNLSDANASGGRIEVGGITTEIIAGTPTTTMPLKLKNLNSNGSIVVSTKLKSALVTVGGIIAKSEWDSGGKYLLSNVISSMNIVSNVKTFAGDDDGISNIKISGIANVYSLDTKLEKVIYAGAITNNSVVDQDDYIQVGKIATCDEMVCDDSDGERVNDLIVNAYNVSNNYFVAKSSNFDVADGVEISITNIKQTLISFGFDENNWIYETENSVPRLNAKYNSNYTPPGSGNGTGNGGTDVTDPETAENNKHNWPMAVGISLSSLLVLFGLGYLVNKKLEARKEKNSQN